MLYVVNIVIFVDCLSICFLFMLWKFDKLDFNWLYTNLLVYHRLMEYRIEINEKLPNHIIKKIYINYNKIQR